MQHQLHASGLIEKALQHEFLLRGDDAEGAMNRGEVVGKLPGAGVGEAGLYLKPVGKGFFGLRPVPAQGFFDFVLDLYAQARDGLRQLSCAPRRLA